MFYFCLILLGIQFAFQGFLEGIEDREKARNFFFEGLYSDAIPLLEKAFEENEADESVRLELALAKLAASDFDGVIELLESCSIKHQKALVLLGVSYSHKKNYKKAIPLLQAFLLGVESEAEFYPEAKLHLGLALFHEGKNKQASDHLREIQASLENKNVYDLAQLALARILITEQKYDEAIALLTPISSRLSDGNLLQFEASYLLGQAYFLSEKYYQAAFLFEKALPRKNQEKAEWYLETLYLLSMSYLKLADQTEDLDPKLSFHLDQAESALKKLMELSPDEKARLALGECYLTRAVRLNEPQSFQEAEKVLLPLEAFVSKEGQAHALFLRAQAAPAYSDRDKLYKQLTKETNRDTPFVAKGFLMRGLNDLKEGEALAKQNRLQESQKILDASIQSFQRAFDLTSGKEPDLSQQAIKYEMQAYAKKIGLHHSLVGNPHFDFRESQNGNFQLEDRIDADTMAFERLESLMNQVHQPIDSLPDPLEIYYLYSLLASKKEKDITEEKYKKIQANFQEKINQFPFSRWKDASLYLLGMIALNQENFREADKSFSRLVDEHPHSSYAGDALYWRSQCAERLLEDPKKIKALRKLVFEKYPESPKAPNAYFKFYSYQEYLQGDKEAIKHLESFHSLYPLSPYTINAFYLIGLDKKRDRKSPEGKSIRKKNLNEAIDAFSEGESTFDHFYKSQLLPKNELNYWIDLRYRIILERALTNFDIALESQGTKQEIYCEYAQEVLRQITEDFKSDKHPLTRYLKFGGSFPSIEEEALYWLSEAYLYDSKEKEAEKTLDLMLEKYRSGKITRGYYLSRTWYKKGVIAMRSALYDSALQCFSNAEDASKTKVLSVDEKLDLWIQQSLCETGLGHFDQAIAILSKVINDDAISQLRLKAMLMRAETYELQGRRELARKQLEALAKKGGEWAIKAKEKLEKDYGYQ